MVGPGVYSATHFRVEYSPDNLFISQETIAIIFYVTYNLNNLDGIYGGEVNNDNMDI